MGGRSAPPGAHERRRGGRRERLQREHNEHADAEAGGRGHCWLLVPLW